MPSDNVELPRRAYEAYSRGDLETMLGFVDPNVEWTYLDPNLPQPEPQVCRRPPGAGGLAQAPVPARPEGRGRDRQDALEVAGLEDLADDIKQ